MPFKTKWYEWQTCTKNLNNTNMQKYQKYTRKTSEKFELFRQHFRGREGYTLHNSTADIYVRIAKSPSMYLERLGIRWDGLQNWVIWAKSLSKCSSFRSQIPIRHISKRLEKGSTLINHPRLTLWYSSNLGESFCEVDFEQIYMNYNYSTFCPLHSCFLLIGVDIHIFMHPEF